MNCSNWTSFPSFDFLLVNGKMATAGNSHELPLETSGTDGTTAEILRELRWLDSAVRDLQSQQSQQSQVPMSQNGHSFPSYDGYAGSSWHQSRTVDPNGKVRFNGEGSWLAFISRFQILANEGNWDPPLRRRNLCYSLDGVAAEYFTYLCSRNPRMGYDELVSRLEKRFHATEMPQVLQMELSSAKQQPAESWYDSDNRLHLSATSNNLTAYPELSDEHIESQAFRKDVRHIGLDEEEVAVSRTAEPQSPLRPSRLNSMEHRVSREIGSFEASTSSPFNDIQSSMQEMESVLTDLAVKTRDQRHTLHPPEKSDLKSPSQSPTRTSNGLCLTCKDHGHFARACPSMSVTVEGNEQGTGEMAPLCP